MRAVSVYEAEGMVLCHDVTEIIPGKCKGRAFKKGHVIRKEDISRLLNIGKEHIYVWEINEQTIHENNAAERLAHAVAGSGLVFANAAEGKVELSAAKSGLLKINTEALERINDIEQIAVATLHSNQMVDMGRKVAGCKIIPLVIETKKIQLIEEICAAYYPVVELKQLNPYKVGVVTTGSEVYHGRIQDCFGPVLKDKFERLGSSILRQIFVPDDISMISEAIHSLLMEGADMIVTTGGMSVDPDDVTPSGIRAAGGRIVTYGAPTLPGAMFMLAYFGQVPVLGLPGCVMYHKSTIFDLVVPRILAGEELSRKDIIRLGHGGLCLVCEECRYPECGFGKGI
ncbi:molybdopterin-binding protein [Sporomusa malonica]|uniref:Molybdopterin molybdenumtransferase n=1 Tax=Sporomusa malonica TaxID=112901 RepID=A0A1W2EPA7_9FIRM|nr:molybdopterin-binding protein [Sporomusa malonica]SMD11553.1 molybdenum cofactor cytidylyltransferase [Sporomusa malonica]